MITENLSTLKIHKLTQQQYKRELENDNIEENAIYLTPEEPYYTTYEIDEKLKKKSNLLVAKDNIILSSDAEGKVSIEAIDTKVT